MFQKDLESDKEQMSPNTKESLIINNLSPQTSDEPKIERVKLRKKKLSVGKYNFKTSPKTNTARVKTPKVPPEVRSQIVRQCSMPSYAVMNKVENQKMLDENKEQSNKVTAA